jgi:flagellar biosynthesis protein FlhB
MIFPVSGAEGLYPFIMGVVLLYLIAFKNKNIAKFFYQYFLAFFLLFFSITHYHPQWFLWISPFLIIELVANRYKNLYLTLGLFACYIFIVFMFEPSLNVGLFAPMNTKLNDFTGFARIISQKTDLNTIKSVVRSVFATLSMFFVFELFTNKTNK